MVQVKVLDDALERPVSVRIKFQKIGKLQYISHLDLVRTMHKMLIRARMPLWFTEGFNPKPKMVFATSMSVGLQSLCEFLDVRITHKIDLQSALDALNACATDELKIIDVYYPESDFTDIAWAEYKINVKSVSMPENVAELCKNVLKTSPLTVLKRTKSGDKNVDISASIGDVVTSLSDDGSVDISVWLKAENTSFLNPEYLITALKNETGMLSGSLLQNIYTILRVAMYDENMETFR